MEIVSAENLGKTYEDGTRALSGLTIGVGQGEIFGLLGPNGSGKTTTVRLLNGTIRPTAGTASVLGLEAGNEKIRSLSSTVAELASLYEYLTVWENLSFFGELYGMTSQEISERTAEILEALELTERRETRLGSLSTGLKKRVQLARALLHRPEVMFLDEPTSGLDPESARHVVNLVKSLAEQEGTTVFLCTHNLPLAERICTSYGFLVDGNLMWNGSRSDLQSLGGPTRLQMTTDQGISEHAIQSDADINRIVTQAIEAGALLQDVRKLEHTLEESYFAIVNGEENESDAS